MHSRFLAKISHSHFTGCACRASFEVINIMVEAYPDAFKIVDTNGDLPLHYASWNGASLDKINILVEAYPEAIKICDQNQSLPLHHGCTCNARPEVIKLLVETYPGALKSVNVNGHLLFYFLFKILPNILAETSSGMLIIWNKFVNP